MRRLCAEMGEGGGYILSPKGTAAGDADAKRGGGGGGIHAAKLRGPDGRFDVARRFIGDSPEDAAGEIEALLRTAERSLSE